MDKLPSEEQAEAALREKGLDATVKDHLNYMIATRSRDITVEHVTKDIKITIKYKAYPLKKKSR